MAPPPPLGRYQLKRRLGAGGMGDVWLATHEDYPGPVVVKRLHEFLAIDPRSVDRFFDELLLMRRLKHPNIARHLDGGRIGDTYFLVMEYVDGLTLVDCLRANGGALRPREAVAVIAQACAGLAHAHSLTDEEGTPLGILHRDIAPDNLMVGWTGTVRVLDFGIARARCSLATTMVGQRRGKLRYAAPEYLEHGLATPRVDVYSMGLTLFELCTGRRPFESCVDAFALARQVLRVGLPAADEVCPGLPIDLVRVIRDATRLSASERLPTIEELGRRLEEFALGLAPVTPGELGDLVQGWQERLRRGDVKRQESLGQLDLTSAQISLVDTSTDPLPPGSRPPGPSSVEFAHALDSTVAVSLADALAEERSRGVPSSPGDQSSVIVSPALLEGWDPD